MKRFICFASALATLVLTSNPAQAVYSGTLFLDLRNHSPATLEVFGGGLTGTLCHDGGAVTVFYLGRKLTIESIPVPHIDHDFNLAIPKGTNRVIFQVDTAEGGSDCAIFFKLSQGPLVVEQTVGSFDPTREIVLDVQ